jgi:hypothetical protein
MRLVVASANLTEPGYRRNREVFAKLEASEDMPLALEAFSNALGFMASLSSLGGGSANPAVQRWNAVIDMAWARLRRLASNYKPFHVMVVFHGIKPAGASLFKKLADAWPPHTGPVRQISFVSPFFDEDAADVKDLVAKIWSLGARKGAVELRSWLPADKETNGSILIRAPKAFGDAQKVNRTTRFHGVLELDGKERRPLHAKAIALTNNRRTMVYIGSSNLTMAGTGLGRRVNWEAGLSFLSSDPALRSWAEDLWDGLDGVTVDEPVFGGTAMDEDAVTVSGVAVLPGAFEQAVYAVRDGRAVVELTLDQNKWMPESWQVAEIRVGSKGISILDREMWESEGRPSLERLPWNHDEAPYGLEVCWPSDGAEVIAWLPVCVEDARSLPPPSELRGLPLDVLIEVLSYARPLSEIIAAWYARKRATSPQVGPVMDALKRVDSSGFLIPRMRRVSAALCALAARLAEPCPTHEALEWRLSGPCGIVAMEKALAEEAVGDPEELDFYRAELCLELLEAAPRTEKNYLPAAEIRQAIRSQASRIAEDLMERREKTNGGMDSYLRKVVEKAKEST